MKRIIFSFVVSLCAVMSIVGQGNIPQPEYGQRCYDYADVLTDSEKANINQTLREFEDITDIEFVIVVISNLSDHGIEPASSKDERRSQLRSLAKTWAKTWGIGDAVHQNGAIYVVSIGNSNHHLETASGLNPFITSSNRREFLKQSGPYYAEKSYAGGMSLMMANIIDHFDLTSWESRTAAYESEQAREIQAMKDFGWSVLMFLFWGFVVVISFVMVRAGVRNVVKRSTRRTRVTQLSQSWESARAIRKSLSSKDYPQWAKKVFVKLTNNLDENLIDASEAIQGLSKISLFDQDHFSSQSYLVEEQISQIMRGIDDVSKELVGDIKFYQEEARPFFDSTMSIITQSRDDIRKGVLENGLQMSVEVNRLEKLAEEQAKLMIDPNDSDSNREVYDATKKNLDELRSIIDLFNDTVEQFGSASDAVTNISSIIQILTHDQKKIMDRYEEVRRHHRGDLVETLTQAFKNVQWVIDYGQGEVVEIEVLIEQPTCSNVQRAHEIATELLLKANNASDFLELLESTQKKLEIAKRDAEHRLGSHRAKFEQARVLSEDPHAGSQSRDHLSRAQRSLETLETEQGLDIMDWILILSLLDDIDTSSDEAYQFAETAIDDYKSPSDYSTSNDTYESTGNTDSYDSDFGGGDGWDSGGGDGGDW